MKKGVALAVLLTCCMFTGCARPTEDGLKLLQEQKYEEAAEKFRQSIEKDKDLAEAYRGLGLAYWELEDYENAKDAFENALEQGAEATGTIYNFLGICEMKAENMEEALSYFRLGIASEGNSEELQREMEMNEIVVCEELGDWELAKSKLAEYTVKYPNDEKAAKESEFLETR